MPLSTTLKSIVSHPLNKKNKVGALFRFAKWQIQSRIVRRGVVHDWVNGSKFIARSGQRGFTQNIYCGLPEFYDMSYVLHVIDPEDLFIDVGANAGSYTILACAARGARGTCFEPVPSTFQRLIENIELNNLTQRVAAHNVALADVESEILFTSELDAKNHVVAPGETARNVIRVKVCTLDSILVGESPSLIKIDVEGLETLVIKGMSQMMNCPSLHSMILEINGNGRRYGFRDEDLITRVESFGFHPYEYDPFQRKLTPVAGKNKKSGNTLFLRKEDFIIQRLKNAPYFTVGSFKI